jgi:uncharacterized protein DUF4255
VSDARAIEAVTDTLRSILDAGVKEVEGSAVVVTRPPDQVGNSGNEMQVNLFLYQADIDGSLRNTDPAGMQPGETGNPPLPLVLHYLVTPYVRDGNDIEAHRMLGAAMRALHEHPVLTPRDLADGGAYSDVSRQIERIRITWQPLGEKDIYSLWSAFQTQYRLSAAYEVRVVLIDSRMPPRTPLPVLQRSRGDTGPHAQPSVETPFPMLTGTTPVSGQAAAQTGEAVVIAGLNLAAASVAVRLAHPLLGTPREIAPDEVSGTTVRFTVPGDALAGLCSVSLALANPPEPEQVTNEVPLAIAPRVQGLPLQVARNGAGTAVVVVTCDPHAQPGQQIFLLLGALGVLASPITTATGSLRFTVTDAPVGKHFTRLRVDGVDSRIIDLSATPPVFLPSQTVTVT